MSTLLDTTDAMVWAEEFCRIFAGATIMPNERLAEFEMTPIVDEGTMVGWFANAIETGRTAGAQAHCPHTYADVFFIVEDDLRSCRGCGKVWSEP
jgi:hypothetical protein